jgi:hypothetical protein
MASWLQAHAAGLELARQAAGKPVLGYEYTTDIPETERANWTPPIRSELSRQLPRGPSLHPSFSSSGACLHHGGVISFQPQWTSTGVGEPDIARRIVVTDLSYRWIDHPGGRRPRTYAELPCGVHEDIWA